MSCSSRHVASLHSHPLRYHFLLPYHYPDFLLTTLFLITLCTVSMSCSPHHTLRELSAFPASAHLLICACPYSVYPVAVSASTHLRTLSIISTPLRRIRPTISPAPAITHPRTTRPTSCLTLTCCPTLWSHVCHLHRHRPHSQ